METTANATAREDNEGHARRPGSSGRLALSVEEASHLLGISKWLAYEMVAHGQIPAIRFGRRLVVPRAALERMLADATPSGAGSDRGV